MFPRMEMAVDQARHQQAAGKIDDSLALHRDIVRRSIEIMAIAQQSQGIAKYRFLQGFAPD